jgi:pyruvate kinase
MELNNILITLDKLYKKNKKVKEVIIDLKGAKIRIGKYPKVNKLPKIIYIKPVDISDNISIIPLKNENFFNAIKPNDKIYLNDANIILDVIEIKKQEIKCEVIKNGELSSNKGINIKNHPIKYRKINEFDKSMILVANKFSFTNFAFSFVLDGSEYKILKKYTNKNITAKIERPESLKFINKINNSFDSIWFCRGDLGAQAGLENLGKLQYEFSKNINKLSKDIYLAGQVLHSLTKFKTPTRTEISALYQIKQEGYKGFVLSDETAIGKNINSLIEFLKLVNT